jgi:urease accessory protein
MPRTAFRLLVTVALLLAPSIAFAHPGHGEDGSLLAGFVHPSSGIDHLLAMTAVGLFAAHLGGRALWAVPVTFVAVMALGGIFGVAGVSLPFAETAIALSVVVFGLLIFSGMAPPVLAAMAMVGIFAFFRGHAHGTEMPANGSWLVYGIGFMAATALLHGLGITLGLAIRWFDEAPRRRAMQACGATIGLIGMGLVIGLV